MNKYWLLIALSIITHLTAYSEKHRDGSIVYELDNTNMTASVISLSGESVVIPEHCYVQRKKRNEDGTYSYYTDQYRVRSVEHGSFGSGIKTVDARYIIEFKGNSYSRETHTPEKIIFGDSLEYIGDYAFFPYGGGISGGIRFPKSLKYIGKGAFQYNYKLKYIDLSKCTQLKEIGQSAFYYCYAKAYNEETGSGTAELTENTGLKSITLNKGLRTIGNSAFYGNHLLESDGALILPQTVDSVGDAAFMGCEKLQSVNFNNASKLGQLILADCYALTHVTLKVGGITDGMFSGCKSLQHLALPEYIDSIGTQAFRECTSLPPDLVLPKGCKLIKALAFAESSVKNVYYQGTMPEMEPFAGCFLKKFDKKRTIIRQSRSTAINRGNKIHKFAFAGAELDAIPESVSELASGAMAGCKSITKINLPLNVTNLNHDSMDDFINKAFSPDGYEKSKSDLQKSYQDRDWSLYYRFSSYLFPSVTGSSSIKDKITSFALHEGIEKIEANALASFTKLDSLTFGHEDMDQSIKAGLIVDNGAFAANTGIRKVVTFHAEPPTLAAGAFPQSVYENAMLYVPEGSKEKYRQAEGWKRFKSIFAQSSITDIHNDNSAIATEYYTIEGIKINPDRLTPGIYIRRQGQKTEKILVN